MYMYMLVCVSPNGLNFPEPPPGLDLLDAPSGCIRDVRGRLEQVVRNGCKLFKAFRIQPMGLKVALWSL